MSAVNVHPGEALQEFLDDYGMSQSQLARELRVPVRRINTIVRGDCSRRAQSFRRYGRATGAFFQQPGRFLAGSSRVVRHQPNRREAGWRTIKNSSGSRLTGAGVSKDWNPRRENPD
jgi:transcriptional regulator with XRE-family HTH domain